MPNGNSFINITSTFIIVQQISAIILQHQVASYMQAQVHERWIKYWKVSFATCTYIIIEDTAITELRYSIIITLVVPRHCFVIWTKTWIYNLGRIIEKYSSISRCIQCLFACRPMQYIIHRGDIYQMVIQRS